MALNATRMPQTKSQPRFTTFGWLLLYGKLWTASLLLDAGQYAGAGAAANAETFCSDKRKLFSMSVVAVSVTSAVTMRRVHPKRSGQCTDEELLADGAPSMSMRGCQCAPCGMTAAILLDVTVMLLAAVMYAQQHAHAAPDLEAFLLLHSRFHHATSSKFFVRHDSLLHPTR